MNDNAKPKPPPAVYRLTPEERESLRAEMKRSAAWAKKQLAIDPELKHLDRDRSDDEQ